jgi:hypothetical protein
MHISTSESGSESYWPPTFRLSRYHHLRKLTRRAIRPALYIPTLVSPLCPSLPPRSPSPTAKLRDDRYLPLLGVFINTFPYTLSLPLPLPFPLPFLCSLAIPYCCLTALPVLITIAIFISIASARTAPSTVQSSEIRLVVVNIHFVDYLLPISSANGQQVAWHVLLAASSLNLGCEIITTLQRQMLTGASNLSREGYQRFGVIELISEGNEVVPMPIVH